MNTKYKSTNFYDSIRILKRLDNHGKSNLDDILTNKSYQSNEMQDVIDLCLDCNVIYIDKKSNIFINDRGKKIASIEGKVNYKYIELLKLYLLTQHPTWIFDIYKGIEVTKSSLLVPENFKHIFKTFNLFDLKNESTIHWWDAIKDIRRNYEESRLTKIGREGEFLIINFERNEKGIEPEHTSVLYGDDAGYDIKSIISKKNKKDLLIEVKNCTQRELRFFISKNEYNTCERNKNNYKIYLIDSSDINLRKLYIFDFDLLNKHIPKNKGLGVFENVQIKPNKKFLDDCKKYNI